MTATVQNVRAVDISNDLSCFNDPQIQCALTEAECFVGGSCGGEAKACLAQSLIAAHILTVSAKGSDGPAGPVTGASAGGLSISFDGAGGQGSAAYFSSTSFGRRYLALKATCITTPLTVRCCAVDV